MTWQDRCKLIAMLEARGFKRRRVNSLRWAKGDYEVWLEDRSYIRVSFIVERWGDCGSCRLEDICNAGNHGGRGWREATIAMIEKAIEKDQTARRALLPEVAPSDTVSTS